MKQFLFIGLAFFGGSVLGLDSLSGNLGGKDFTITLEHLEVGEDETFDTRAKVVTDDGDVELPCTSGGNFWRKTDKSYEGERRVFCQLSAQGSDKQHDAINLGITYNYTQKNVSSPRRGVYTLDVSLLDESDDEPLSEEYGILGGEEVDALQLEATVERSPSVGVFALIARVEASLYPYIGRSFAVPELDGDVQQAWGYSYNVDENYLVNIDGRFSAKGSPFHIGTEVSVLSNPKSKELKFASLKQLLVRMDAAIGAANVKEEAEKRAARSAEKPN